MLKNVFTNTSKSLLANTKLNDLNGHDAERLSASSLTLALNCRISWASRKEDNAKTDLILTMLHPWIENKAEVILTQVKSGNSYAEVNPSDNYHFKIVKNKFKSFLNQNHHTLICWTERESNEIFWFIIKANSQYYRNTYGLSHKLSPATRFDVIRVLNGFGDRNGGKGLQFAAKESNAEQIRFKYSYEYFKKLRRTAKNCYNKLKVNNLSSNIFGKIEVTNYGWRHITRESRWSQYKVSSYEIIPILDKILERSPTKHFIQNYWEETNDVNKYRKTEYLLEYHQIKKNVFSESKLMNVDVYIKLIEIIEYPKNWRENSKLSQSINRRVIFKSIYYKQKSS